MQTVPRDLILEVWERQCALDLEPTRTLMMRFLEEQPAVGIYLTANDEQLGDEAEQSQLIPLAATVWESMTLTRGRRMKMVRPKVIDRAETTNLLTLEKLDEGSELDWHKSAEQLLTGYNQQPLLTFCLEILMADDEETPELAPERIGMEWLWLKTIIDCFDE